MRAAIAAIAAIALLTVTFAGCLSTDGETKGLAAVYGSANVLEIAGISIINGPGPMGHLGANGTDTQVVSMNIEVPKQTITKTNTQPANGQAIALTPAAVNTTAAFTLPKASQLGGYQAVWVVLPYTAKNLTGSQAQAYAKKAKVSPPMPATSSYEANVDKVGTFVVSALLQKGGKPVGIYVNSGYIAVSAHWIVESSVFPLRPQGGPAPTNFEQMADKFAFPLASAIGRLDLETKFRGTYNPTMGTDVDLELDDATGKPVNGNKMTTDPSRGCQGTGGQSRMLPTPDPVEASEKMEQAPLEGDAYTIRVGAMSTNCASYYHNAGNVPYTLDIKVDATPVIVTAPTTSGGNLTALWLR